MNDGPSHYGRDFRDNNDHHQPPPPPRDFGGPNNGPMNSGMGMGDKGKHNRDGSGDMPFRPEIANPNANRNFRGGPPPRGPPPRGPGPPPPPGGLNERDRDMRGGMINRDPSWTSDNGPPGGPRGDFRRSRSFTNEDGKEGPHGLHNNNNMISSQYADQIE